MERDPAPNHDGTVSSPGGGGATTTHPRLPIAEVGVANKRAQIRGMLIGIAGGVCSAFISKRALNLNSNQSLLSGLLAGTGVAYVAARQELTHNLETLEASHRRTSEAGEAEMTQLDLRSAHERQFDAGVAGLHTLEDRAASTRGDH
ncbi:uncharacterized protein PFL1_05731 [Pseudozyma flocculosa PF-1]|uniref:Uncharacterized protein n=2 Tax=Pseudozyma flocculosa TaxID=84751 RepID=A0A5C3F8Y5_9BASI|nr:uncharacterized protein PFL1_05731 [Pseudozyma flocculosa PF-1]EPQ26752.1 hypothetical protein PFL1_05731 [Pseudozyma flocculosa PF-1]SPO40923.1 uncharacterized protein PSFLO_06405 [Pseudozyma flocculosa]